MRKLIILTIAMVCFSFLSQAQISKGSTFLGGSLSFGSGSSKSENSSTTKSESSNWNISPQFGKAIKENRIVGVFLNYGHSQSEYMNGAQLQKDKSNTYGGGVFYRRYFQMASRFYLFGESALGFGIGKEERRFGDLIQNTVNRTNINLGITPGLSFAAGKKIHLEASFNSLLNVFYQTSKHEQPFANNTFTQKQFGIGANANGFSNLSVGIRWILPSK